MQINFGENLKRLRRERDLTQEDVAQFLNTTFQTISKWERGETMPDIAVLPALARYFETTTDELLGVAKLDEEAKMWEYFKLDRVYGNNGQSEEALAMWREAYAEFPHNKNARGHLMHSLYDSFVRNDENINADEIIAHANALLSSDDQDWRSSAIEILCYIHARMGSLEEAEKYAMMAPLVIFTQGTLLESVYTGEKLVNRTQRNITESLDDIFRSVRHLVRAKNDDIAYCIHAYETLVKLFETLYEDGDFGFYHDRMKDIYRWLAHPYAKTKNAAEVFRCIKLARHHAVEWDTAVTHTLTAPLVNTLEFDITDYVSNTPNPRNSDTTDWLDDEVYDFLRDTPEFKALLAD